MRVAPPKKAAVASFPDSIPPIVPLPVVKEAPVAATPAPSEATVAAPVVSVPTVSAATTTAKTPPEAAHCSVDAADMEPAKILRLLSRQTGVNLVLLGKDESKITLRLSDVPLTEIIKHIAAMTGTAFLKVADTFVIGTPERLTANYPLEWKAANATPVQEAPTVAEIVTDSFRTSFVSASGLAAALTSLMKDVSVVAGPTATTPSIAALDGSQSTGAASTTLAAQDVAASARTILIQGTRPAVDRALALARRLDAPRAQVAIAVTVHDLSNDALKDLGISWDFGGFTIAEKPSGFNVGSIGRTGLSASAAIKAIESRGAAKLLASPSISMLDGERGFVLIGNRINFPVLTGYTQNNAPIFDIKEQRVGIYLQVAANVGADGSVTMSLYPQVSTVSSFLQVNGASYPQISTREAQTTVRVASGESVVLGGLIRDEDVSLMEKVPVLGNVPLLGELFRHRKTTHNSSQVILTVTPTVIMPEVRK